MSDQERLGIFVAFSFDSSDSSIETNWHSIGPPIEQFRRRGIHVCGQKLYASLSFTTHLSV